MHMGESVSDTDTGGKYYVNCIKSVVVQKNTQVLSKNPLPLHIPSITYNQDKNNLLIT